ncbi:MAG: class I SAM-dependent methyltransferase [Methanocellales archaeon]|nr:class I SAM-dependent methyltransferase [Methanocellales archaeon]
MISKQLIKGIKNPWKAILFLVSTIYNIFIDLKHHKKLISAEELKELDKIKEHLITRTNIEEHLILKELEDIKRQSIKKTDISDHLVTLFVESLSTKPRLIVELGVRGGESTFVLERVAKLCDSTLISVDIEDCSDISSYKNWIFVQSDDIEFAKRFEKWCARHDIQPKINVLFVDTSHIFENTVQEIENWFPFLRERSKVFFHDTNLKRLFFRRDGSMGVGRNNKRGVIRAIEEYFDKGFNEKEDFIELIDGWQIKHYANCNGFTILEKIEQSSGYEK